MLPVQRGTCRRFLHRWYYDDDKNECFSFIFHGCRQNKNNFETEEECLDTCQFIDEDFSSEDLGPEDE